MVEQTFTAIDFETATWNSSSICQVGIIRIENGERVAEVNELIQPPGNTYFYKNIEIHGIKPEDTVDSPTFYDIWHEFKYLIEDQVFVAHNVGFDAGCLRSTLAYYDLAQPKFEEKCTRKIFRRGLAYLSKKYKIPLNHHDALSDANACAQLYLRHLAHQNLPKTGSLFPEYPS